MKALMSLARLDAHKCMRMHVFTCECEQTKNVDNNFIILKILWIEIERVNDVVNSSGCSKTKVTPHSAICNLTKVTWYSRKSSMMGKHLKNESKKKKKPSSKRNKVDLRAYTSDILTNSIEFRIVSLAFHWIAWEMISNASTHAKMMNDNCRFIVIQWESIFIVICLYNDE